MAFVNAVKVSLSSMYSLIHGKKINGDRTFLMRAGGETGGEFTLEKISGYTMYTLLIAGSLFDRQEASLLLRFLT